MDSGLWGGMAKGLQMHKEAHQGSILDEASLFCSSLFVLPYPIFLEVVSVFEWSRSDNSLE